LSEGYHPNPPKTIFKPALDIFYFTFTRLMIANLQAQEALITTVERFCGYYGISSSVNPEPDNEFNPVIDLLTAQLEKTN